MGSFGPIDDRTDRSALAEVFARGEHHTGHSGCCHRHGLSSSRRDHLPGAAVGRVAAGRGPHHRNSIRALGRRRILRSRARGARSVGVEMGRVPR